MYLRVHPEAGASTPPLASHALSSARTLVVPSNVASSYLMNKLTGVDICGAKMPKTGTISTANVDKIRTWICSGAKND